MGIEDRIDQMARRVAGDEPGIFLGIGAPGRGVDSALDGVARALAAPLSRRRALAAAGGVVAAASLLRPARASADCWPGGPKVCENSHGAKVCVPANLNCCSNENCAIACPYPWRVCAGPAICNDTASMCFDKSNPQYDKTKTKFCSQTVSVVNGCVDAGMSDAIRGWCCNVAEDCGPDFGQCTCPSPCGDECCKPTARTACVTKVRRVASTAARRAAPARGAAVSRHPRPRRARRARSMGSRGSSTA
jgi:hypothetical protein